MNCCDDYGMCIRGPGCPAGESARAAHLAQSKIDGYKLTALWLVYLAAVGLLVTVAVAPAWSTDRMADFVGFVRVIGWGMVRALN